MFKIVIAYIFESEKGAGGIHCTSPPPHSLKYRVIKTPELCSCGKEKKHVQKIYSTWPQICSTDRKPFDCAKLNNFEQNIVLNIRNVWQ